MGQACCNYAPKDANAKNFGKNMQLANRSVKIDNAELMKAVQAGKKNEAAVIKI